MTNLFEVKCKDCEEFKMLFTQSDTTYGFEIVRDGVDNHFETTGYNHSISIDVKFVA